LWDGKGYSNNSISVDSNQISMQYSCRINVF
jgi:hypothetical protein